MTGSPEVLRAGRLVSRSGSHCLPLSWLVRRPTAFTDEPYDLSLHPPIRLERRRRLVSALVRAGEAAALRADYATAADRYGEALDVDGTLPYLHLRRCAALTRLARLPDALRDADAAVALAPTWWMARFRRSLCLIALGEVVPAAEELKQACALSETQLTPTAAGRLQRLVARLETAGLASPTITTAL